LINSANTSQEELPTEKIDYFVVLFIKSILFKQKEAS
jgi:hypothetical protein